MTDLYEFRFAADAVEAHHFKGRTPAVGGNLMSTPPGMGKTKFPKFGFFPDDVALNRQSWRVWTNLPNDRARTEYATLIGILTSSTTMTTEAAEAPIRFLRAFVTALAEVKSLPICGWYTRRAPGPPPLEDRVRHFLFGQREYDEILDRAELYGEEAVSDIAQAIRNLRFEYSPARLLYGSDKSPGLMLESFISEMNDLLVNMTWIRSEVALLAPNGGKIRLANLDTGYGSSSISQLPSKRLRTR